MKCEGEDFDFGSFDSSDESSPEHGSCHDGQRLMSDEDEPAVSGTESKDFNFDNEVCNCCLTLCVNSFACLKPAFYFIVQSLNSGSSSGSEIWSSLDDYTDDDEPKRNDRETSLVQVTTIFVLLWQSVFKVSNIAVSILLQFFSTFLIQLAYITQLESMKALSNKFSQCITQGSQHCKDKP